jgi:DNA repair protein RadC
LEIELLDHVIVGEQGRYYSFGDAGKIPEAT